MISVYILLNIFIICALLQSFFISTLALSENRVWLVYRIVGKDYTNFLFRGDLPLTNGQFNYNDLYSYMQIKALLDDITLPTDANDIYMIDISFMNIIDQPQAEVDFWKNNPNLGEFINYPLGVSGLTHPSDYSNVTQRNEIALTTAWDFDQIPQRLQILHQILHSAGPINESTGKPRHKVVYMHCQAGCDRTGQVVIGWRLLTAPKNDLQNKQLLEKLFALNVKECGRPPNDFSVGGTEWFCIWMNLTLGADIGNCLHIADCHRFKACSFPPKNPNGTNDYDDTK